VAVVAGSIGTDGSIRGSLRATAQAVLDLDSMGSRSVERDRLVEWLLGRQGLPGAFHEGCTAARHQHRTCEHFLGGFFSPLPPARRAAPVTLATGKEYRLESQARFALSCLALEAVVRSGRIHEAPVERHLDSFAALVEEWALWGDYLAPDLAFGALAALGGAGGRWRPTREALIGVIGARQLADGTWPQVDLFNAIDGLLRADSPLAGPLIDRTRATLRLRQRDDGSFGSVAEEERALLAAKAVAAAGDRGCRGRGPAPAQ
jgi:hypothetical protein